MNMPLITLPVVIKPPFRLDEISLDQGQADFFTENDEFCLEVKFNARYFKDGDGFQTWKDADIEELCNIKVYNEDGLLDHFYINPQNWDVLKEAIEQEVQERLL